VEEQNMLCSTGSFESCDDDCFSIIYAVIIYKDVMITTSLDYTTVFCFLYTTAH